MFARVLECAVCQTTFNTRKKWLTHLLQPDHQSKAQEEICRWDQSERDCALVAFSALPIASLELLQFFSKGSMDLVTDFVWFDNRPKVGFIRFESKYKLEEILTSVGVPDVRINDQLVQIKRAGECLQLEWQELIPLRFEELLKGSAQQECELEPPLDIIFNQNTNIPITFVRRRKPDPAQFLFSQYDLICQEIEIPDEEFNAALKFLKMLQIELTKKFPSCQVVWFRNWYLKLKSTSATNELSFFVDQEGNYGNHITDIRTDYKQFPPMGKGKPNELFLTFPHLNITAVTDKIYKATDNFVCQTNGLTLTLCMVAVPSIFLPEVQACRLAAYFCSFDSRVKPLLTVIRYWAKINKIRLENLNETSYKVAPDPAALDWLVLFFLYNKMKILPTPQELKERSHPKLFYNLLDIGFHVDPSFAQQFSDLYKETDKEIHFFNVFNLVTMFFKFYSKELGLGTGRNIILNTRNGKIIPREKYVREIEPFPENLTVPETKRAKRGRVITIPEGSTFHLLHPLYPPFGFSLCDKNFVTTVCPAMEITGKKLKRALNLYKSGQKFDIKSVLQAIL
ncbi:unnamed protein product [Orchesella dallaii]|uniref:C2H2-type domain-containing protein n=1 Tax=Orchesella dallaii TaxID=48710 RepID=A0ABP1S0L9_9HEXA